jgi:hypothetical protein
MHLPSFTLGVFCGSLLVTACMLSFVVGYVRQLRVSNDAFLRRMQSFYDASIDEVRALAGLRPLPRHEPKRGHD